jgi:hypothetical protein
LIPIGVSSSRLGAELPPGSTTGPGGAIIIGENARWGGERRGSRGGRRGGELAQFLQNLGGGGPDMEEMMMMEAMRLSLLEHEEQQRRQAQDRSGEEQPTNSSVVQGAATTATLPETVSSTSLSPVQQRSSSLTADEPGALMSNPAPIFTSTNPQDLGLSSNMIAELSELIEGGLSLPPRSEALSASAVAENNSHVSEARPAAPPVASPPVAIPSARPIYAATSTPPAQFHSPAQSPIHTPMYGTPTRIGMNPNNPFRRGAGSTTTSPTHSRQPSSAPFAATSHGGESGPSGTNTPH